MLERSTCHSSRVTSLFSRIETIGKKNTTRPGLASWSAQQRVWQACDKTTVLLVTAIAAVVGGDGDDARPGGVSRKLPEIDSANACSDRCGRACYSTKKVCGRD
jgi:hypothetical protein